MHRSRRPDQHPLRPRGWLRRVAGRLAAAVAVAILALGPLAISGAAAGTLAMEARILLQGHARVGSWSAIEVDLKNDGPPILGELRMDGGEQSGTRYSMAVNLPTNSHQVYVLHGQPPAFGRNVKVELVADGQVLDSVNVAYLAHEASQLIVGVLAERPNGIIAGLDLPTNQFGPAPAIVPLGLADLPQRAEGWATLDRLVWQDIDSNQLTGGQLESLRRWLAAGGQLVIVGGTAGINTLSGFPDDLLPFRPTATLDLDPSRLQSLIGAAPDGADAIPAMAGQLARGKALATSGDRAVAGVVGYGSGRVTLLGFDPRTTWLAESKGIGALWRSVLPSQTGQRGVLLDDSQLVQAVYQLPVLALPPTAGLLAIIAAYILIIGPINYLILKRLDRRELAWITMPVLVITFAAASFGYGSFLRGTDVVVNEVAIIRGAPDATEATAQVYFGVFSPTRATYRVQVPQGGLLAGPISGSIFGQSSVVLDILQGTGAEQPSEVRNLSVGTGSLRVVRAELPVDGPRIRARLDLVDGVLVGTLENASAQSLEGVAVVLGTSVVVLGDVAPETTVNVRLRVTQNPFGSSIADQVVGVTFDSSSEAGIRRSVRYSMVQQLTYDPTGSFGGGLPADQAVILAFGREQVLDLSIGSEAPRRNGNVLYYVPVDFGIRGSTTFSGDLLTNTVVDSNAQFFSKERLFLNMGPGSATLAYRPVSFEGTFTIGELRLVLGSGGNHPPGRGGKEIRPLPAIPVPCLDAANTIPEGCAPPRNDFLPEVEVFDRTAAGGAGAWVRLPQLASDAPYVLAEPSRYVDPVTAQVLVRFVNETQEQGLGFGFQLALVGTVQ